MENAFNNQESGTRNEHLIERYSDGAKGKHAFRQ